MTKARLSIVALVRDAELSVGQALRDLHATAREISDDVQIIVVDTGSSDGTIAEIEDVLAGVPDIEVLCLSGHGEGLAARDVAFMAGLEHAVIGDCVVLMDLSEDPISTIPAMVEMVRDGADVASAKATRPNGSCAYHACSAIYRGVVGVFGGADPRRESTRFRAMSRRFAAYLLRHDPSVIGQRAMPGLKGFKAFDVERIGVPAGAPGKKTLVDGFKLALGLMTATSTTPLRVATGVCSMGALLSLLQSAWAVGTYALKGDVAPGWTTLSLQVSSMFLLLSIAIAAIAEYVGTLSRLGRPPYHVGRQICSAVITREGQLNVTAA